MKFVIAIFLLFGLQSLSAQTELINHKSHSGTNRTFVIAKNTGNFGLRSIQGELEKDSKSSYKLIYSEEGNMVSYILFKTKNKVLDNAMCMTNDEVIENISFTGLSSNLREGVVKLLIEELRRLRKQEKP